MNPNNQKILIIYQTHSGTTEKATEFLAEKLGTEATIVNLKKGKVPPLDDYNKVIIGGSIRASNIQKGIKKYIAANIEALKDKDIGLYLCCMEEGENALKQFNDSYPEELRSIAKATGFFGGEFNLEKLNFLEKGIIKKVAGVTESVSKMNYEAIEQFALDIMS